MRIDIITIFPEMFEGPLSESIIKRAQQKQLLEINLHQLRDHTTDKHKRVDDYAFSGGAGMVMMIEPIAKCIESLTTERSYDEVIYMSPDGNLLEEISIGNYVLSGGELAAAVFIDSIVRLIPGVLGDETSALSDSFQNDLISPPAYTRPREFRGWKVPDILLSGNEKLIEEWKLDQSLKRTAERKPELLKNCED